LKNSKKLVFYEIIKDDSGKLKLNKQEKFIATTRKFEIKNVVFSKCGNYIATTGSGQDTVLQVYDANKLTLIESIDIAEVFKINILDSKFRNENDPR
jgi:WD40 repeat protein